MKLELTPEEGVVMRSAAQRYLRDLRLELPDSEEIEARKMRWERESFILGLLKRMKA